MKRFPILASFALVSMLCCEPAAAQRVSPRAESQFNWNQTTGLVNIPVARTMRQGTFYGAFDFKSKSLSSLFSSEFLASPGDVGNGSFHFMVSPHDRLEIAVMGLHDADRGGNVNTLGKLFKIPPARDFSSAIKLLLTEEDDDFPAIAIGVENLSHPHNGDFEPSARNFEKGFYAVASKQFPVGDQALNLHLGFGTGRFQNRPFGGVEFAFENGLALIGEYDGWQGSFGVRYSGLRNLRLTLAVQGGQPTFQIGYMFNPFDLISDGDQYDYDPYKRPGQKPEDRGEKPEKDADGQKVEPEKGAKPKPNPEVEHEEGSLPGLFVTDGLRSPTDAALPPLKMPQASVPAGSPSVQAAMVRVAPVPMAVQPPTPAAKEAVPVAAQPPAPAATEAAPVVQPPAPAAKVAAPASEPPPAPATRTAVPVKAAPSPKRELYIVPKLVMPPAPARVSTTQRAETLQAPARQLALPPAPAVFPAPAPVIEQASKATVGPARPHQPHESLEEPRSNSEASHEEAYMGSPQALVTG